MGDRRGGDDLVAVSLDVIAAGQYQSGGYVAAPCYPTYAYAWLRDGSFCAYAMDLHERRESASAFHRFVSNTVLRYRDLSRSADGRPRVGDAPRVTGWTAASKPAKPGRRVHSMAQPVALGSPRPRVVGQCTRSRRALRGEDRRRVPAARCNHALLRLLGREWGPAAHLHTCQRDRGSAGRRRAGRRRLWFLGGRASARSVAQAARLGWILHQVRRIDCRIRSLLWLALTFGVVDVQDPLMMRTAARVTTKWSARAAGSAAISATVSTAGASGFR